MIPLVETTLTTPHEPLSILTTPHEPLSILTTPMILTAETLSTQMILPLKAHSIQPHRLLPNQLVHSKVVLPHQSDIHPTEVIYIPFNQLIHHTKVLYLQFTQLLHHTKVLYLQFVLLILSEIAPPRIHSEKKTPSLLYRNISTPAQIFLPYFPEWMIPDSFSLYSTNSQLALVTSTPWAMPVSYTHLTLPTIYSV